MEKLSSMRNKIDEAFEYVVNSLFSEKTCLIYDHIVNGREHKFPSAEEIARRYPNPCGYSTGMEDGMINGATMLDACLIRYEKEGDTTAASFAGKLVRGMLGCIFSAKSEGYVPRALSPQDGKSYYPDSSRDQYTMFAFGMHRYLNCPLCSDAEKKDIEKAAVAVARRAEKNITAENKYDMLTDDGRPTLATVMWGDKMGNHEYLRLPMIYMLAYESSRDEYWLEKYLEIRQEAYEKSLPMTGYWALYTLQQMQASILVCHDVDPDESWRVKHASLMNAVAEYAESIAENIRKKVEARQNYNAAQKSFRDLETVPSPRFAKLGYEESLSVLRPDTTEFFTLQDSAQVAIISKLAPGRKTSEKAVALLADSFAKIDLSKHERNLPIYFIDGYYRSIL